MKIDSAIDKEFPSCASFLADVDTWEGETSVMYVVCGIL